MAEKEVLERKIAKTKRKLERLETELYRTKSIESINSIVESISNIYKIVADAKKPEPRKMSDVCEMCDMDSGIAVDRKTYKINLHFFQRESEPEEIYFRYSGKEEVSVSEKDGYRTEIHSIVNDLDSGEMTIHGKYIRNK